MNTDEHSQPHPRRRSSDQILEGWTWSKIQRIGAALVTLGSIVFAVITFFLNVLVTKPQLDKKLSSIQRAETTFFDSLSAVNRRVQTVERHQQDADTIHRLLVPLAKLECIRLQRENSSTLGDIAELPCYRLLRNSPIR